MAMVMAMAMALAMTMVMAMDMIMAMTTWSQHSREKAHLPPPTPYLLGVWSLLQNHGFYLGGGSMEKTFRSLIRLRKISPYINACPFHTATYYRNPSEPTPQSMQNKLVDLGAQFQHIDTMSEPIGAQSGTHCFSLKDRIQ